MILSSQVGMGWGIPPAPTVVTFTDEEAGTIVGKPATETVPWYKQPLVLGLGAAVAIAAALKMRS